ncbi:hypothetical protein PENSUB_13011 [Penicillium subrubescens]|uniref:Uncharacterized protein n=1 Tax=Penicillium subrubescens TaxID=1316194 RepID=A0A1Q5SUE4_9EURO|nr:hypothetical protein PENSUB_13011 [Penicillium subrubescens]
MKNVAGWFSFEALRRDWDGGWVWVWVSSEEEEGWVGAEFGSGSASTKKGDMKAFPESKGVEKESSARATPSASRSADSASDDGVQTVVSGTGKRRQPTVKRGSSRVSRGLAYFMLGAAAAGAAYWRWAAHEGCWALLGVNWASHGRGGTAMTVERV